jgi:hypothetical protein
VATYYVATTGSNTTGTGAIGAPWATLAHALSNSSGADIIYLRGGTYTGSTPLTGYADMDGRQVKGYPSEDVGIYGVSGQYSNIHFSDLSSVNGGYPSVRDCSWTNVHFRERYGTAPNELVTLGWTNFLISHSGGSVWGNTFTNCVYDAAMEEVASIDGGILGYQTTITGVGAGYLDVALATGAIVGDYLLVTNGSDAGAYFRITGISSLRFTLDMSDYLDGTARSTTGLTSATCIVGHAGVENTWDGCTFYATVASCSWNQPTDDQLIYDSDPAQPAFKFGREYLGNDLNGTSGRASALTFWISCYGNLVQDCHFI